MTTDKYREWDAAYVLGSLSPAERREYEQHLALCPDCAADVSALAGLSGPLAALPAEQAFELLETPDGATAPSVLPTLAKRAERQRRRSRWRAAAAVVTAAAAAAAIALAVSWPETPAEPPAGPSSLVAMEQVVPSPVTAETKLTASAWGTRIEGLCRYGDPGSWREPDSYVLVVTNGYGESQRLSTWTAPSGAGTWSFAANTSVPLKYVEKVEIVAVYPDKEVTLLATDL